jgi:hypothetical protein
VGAQEGKVGALQATNKYQQTSINHVELARMGIKIEKKNQGKAAEQSRAEQDRKEEEFSEFINKIKKEMQKDEVTFEINQTTSQQLEQKKRAKIKANKEVYCVSVDYHEELQYVAVALVDREVYIYKAKQAGNKVGFHTIFSFRANIPNGATISTISVEKYVTNGKPILILGTFSGDVLIYWLTIDPEFEFLTEKQKLAERKEPKLFKKFNFFDKNLPKATKAEIDAHSN